ncbi:MAG: acyltransferase [marine bacterium B5-7]|nr:MAG: acyltransferase [marine bacterium B5-7]
MDYSPSRWAYCLAFTLKLLGNISWDVRGTEQLSREQWYMVMSNHQSWADIAILYIALRGKIPLLKFFMKRQLLWIPCVGWSCWLLGYPFVYRYTRDFLRKHPEKKGKDWENTKKACERLQWAPVSIINFAEGTRLTPEKHARQASPYQHLLAPKAGGTAYTLEAMQHKIQTLLDITLVYRPGAISFWRLFSGEIKQITVDVDVLPITDDLVGEYQKDRVFRKHFQAFLNTRWQRKDALIDAVKRA